MRWRTILIFLPFALLAVALAVANRAPVVLSLDPFSQSDPALTLQAPLAVILLGAVLLGVLVGGFFVWWEQGRFRKKAREAPKSKSMKP